MTSEQQPRDSEGRFVSPTDAQRVQATQQIKAGFTAYALGLTEKQQEKQQPSEEEQERLTRAQFLRGLLLGNQDNEESE